MSLTPWLVGVSLAAVGGMYFVSEWRVSARETKIEAANVMLVKWEKSYESAKMAADANLVAYNSEKAARLLQAEVAAKAKEAERKRTAELNAARKRIQNAPTTDDGPVAPVLRNALDGLRPDVGNPPPDSADANPSGATASEPVGPPLPGETPAT